MKCARQNISLLQDAAARAALWLLNDLPAAVETLLFPDRILAPISATEQQNSDCRARSQVHSMASWVGAQACRTGGDNLPSLSLLPSEGQHSPAAGC